MPSNVSICTELFILCQKVTLWFGIFYGLVSTYVVLDFFFFFHLVLRRWGKLISRYAHALSYPPLIVDTFRRIKWSWFELKRLRIGNVVRLICGFDCEVIPLLWWDSIERTIFVSWSFLSCPLLFHLILSLFFSVVSVFVSSSFAILLMVLPVSLSLSLSLSLFVAYDLWGDSLYWLCVVE